MTFALDACRHFLSIRLGRWEVFAQHKGSPFYARETDRPFALVSARNGLRHVRGFTMNARGFALLVMGFSGAEALRLKTRFLDAFDAMAERENDNHCAFLQSMKRTGPARYPRVSH